MKRVLDVLFDGLYDNRGVSVYNTHTKYTTHEFDGSITEVLERYGHEFIEDIDERDDGIDIFI